MGAVDISAQVRTWAMAEVEKQSFGEEFGVDVGWDAVPGPQGAQVGYRLMLTCRSPLLGEGPLFSLGSLVTPRPDEDQVAELVTEMIRQIRGVAQQKLAASKAAISRAMN
jgi:hypothetical protein